jgi:hypothetical protein
MLRIKSAIGVPVVRPSNTPDSISTVSGSRRCVTWRDVPGRRRSSSAWMSLSASAMPGGQPSTTQPIAGPCDSPNEVNVKRVPEVLPDMRSSLASRVSAAGAAKPRQDPKGRRHATERRPTASTPRLL